MYPTLEVERLRAAIRQHRDERGDDRCHADDGRLYAVLPEGDTRPERETLVTLENCQRYIECRQTGREYVSPQRRIEELESEVERLRAAMDFTYCAWCLHKERGDADGSRIAMHIRTCDKHPMRQVEAEVERLRAALQIANDRNSRLYAVLPEAVPAENVAVRHSANATANSKPESS